MKYEGHERRDTPKDVTLVRVVTTIVTAIMILLMSWVGVNTATSKVELATLSIRMLSVETQIYELRTLLTNSNKELINKVQNNSNDILLLKQLHKNGH